MQRISVISICPWDGPPFPGKGRCPLPDPHPRLMRRRACLRQLHSLYLLFSRGVKELLFMICAPSCLARPSLADSARLGIRPSRRGCRETPSGLALPGHLPRFGGGLWEMDLLCYHVKRLWWGNLCSWDASYSRYVYLSLRWTAFPR